MAYLFNKHIASAVGKSGENEKLIQMEINKCDLQCDIRRVWQHVTAGTYFVPL